MSRVREYLGIGQKRGREIGREREGEGGKRRESN